MEKVYLIVYSCEPNQGGEHEVGWKVASSLQHSIGNQLTVVTRTSNKKIIDEYGYEGINFVFIENDSFMRFKPRGEFSYFYYLCWQLSAFLYLRKKVDKNDIVHLLTFGNIHLPHFLHLLRAKLILGPMGGGAIVNTRLMRKPTLKLWLKSFIYRLVNWSVKINPWYYWMLYKSQKVILRTQETLQVLPSYFHHKCDVFLETGVDSINFPIFSHKIRTLERIITVSRMIETKCVDQAVEVFLKLQELVPQKLTFDIIGGGPLLTSLEKKYSGIDGVNFKGKVPHQSITTYLNRSDLFLFCSIKEGGSHALFEAALANLPIACYNISGMTEFPSSKYAITIDPTRDIDNNIVKLAEEIVKEFKVGGKIDKMCKDNLTNLLKSYDWNKITDNFIEYYKESGAC